MADEVLTYAIKMDTAQATPALKDMGETAKEADADVLRLASDLGKLSEAEVRTAAAIRDAKTSLDNQASALGLSRGELLQMRKSMGELTTPTKAVAVGLEQTAEAALKSGRSMADINNRSKILRAQFADIGVTLAGGMNPFVVLAQQGPDVAFALGDMATASDVLSKTFGRLIAITGPLAIGVAAISLAYTVYSIETAKANEKSDMMQKSLDMLTASAKKTSEALERAKGSWESFQGLSTSLEQRLDVLAGLRSQAEIDRENMLAQIEEQTMPTIKALGQRLAQTEAELAIKREQLKDIRTRTEGEAIEQEIYRLEQLQTHTAKNLESYKLQKIEAEMLVDAVIAAEAAEEKRVEVQKEGVKIAKKQTKELEKQATELERIMAAQVSRENTRTREAFSSAGAAASTAAGLDMTQLRAAELELGFTLAELQQALAETTDAAEAEAIRDFIQALITSASEVRSFGVTVEQASRSQRAAGGITTAVGVAAGGSSSITSLLGSAGPYGALAATAIGLMESLAAGGEDNPLQDIAELPLRVVEGMDELVPALVRAVTTLLTEAQPAFVQALPDLFVDVVTIALPGIAKAMVQSIWILLTESIPSIINSVRENLGTVFGMAVRELRDLNLRESIGEALAKAFTVDFWREVIQGLIEAIREFRFSDIDTPGLDAFRSAAGFQERERQTLGQRIDAVRDGAGGIRSVVVNVSGVIGDGRDIRRHLRNLSFRRDGVGSVG